MNRICLNELKSMTKTDLILLIINKDRQMVNEIRFIKEAYLGNLERDNKDLKEKNIKLRKKTDLFQKEKIV